MKHLQKYKTFESQFIAKPGLKGGMDVNTFYNVSEDAKDIFYDLTESGDYKCRTYLNNTENPTTEYTGTNFSVEITKPRRDGIYVSEGAIFYYRDISDEIDRIYKYMETDKWIGTWTPIVEGVCQYYAGEKEDSWTGIYVPDYKYYSAGWKRFKHTMFEKNSKVPLKMVKINFTLGR